MAFSIFPGWKLPSFKMSLKNKLPSILGSTNWGESWCLGHLNEGKHGWQEHQHGVLMGCRGNFYPKENGKWKIATGINVDPVLQ